MQTIRSDGGRGVTVERLFFDPDENIRVIEIIQGSDATEEDIVSAVERYLKDTAKFS